MGAQPVKDGVDGVDGERRRGMPGVFTGALGAVLVATGA